MKIKIYSIYRGEQWQLSLSRGVEVEIKDIINSAGHQRAMEIKVDGK